MSDEMDEIWGLFADEGGQALDTVEEILLSLKQSPTSQVDIGALFRAMHTFKGNSRVLGLGVIESRAHLAEDLIGLVRDDGVPLGPELLELLVETVDSLRGMLEKTLATRLDSDEATTSELAERMRAMFDRCKAGEAPEAAPAPPQDEPALELVSQPEQPSEDAAFPQTSEGLVFEPVARSSLAEDPMYRDIFSAMARDVLATILRSVDSFPSDAEAAQATAAGEAERLRFAAEQIGLSEWRDALADFTAAPPPSMEQTRSLVAQLTAMFDRDFGTRDSEAAVEEPSQRPVPASDDAIHGFFEAIAPSIAAISVADERMWKGDVVASDDLRGLVDDIAALCEPMGFERLARAARGFLQANGNSIKFRRAKFRFYAELAAIAELSPEWADILLPIRPLADLQAWCAECAPKILLEIRSALDWIRVGPERREPISEQLRFIFHACGHHKLDMAGRLSMALVDLFARAEIGDNPPDPLLQHIARSFIAVMELVFDAANAGGSPDMTAVEALFQEAAAATFASSSHIEARLALPDSFHNLLSPESVQTALTAMHDRLLFYIVRADLNSNDELATAFLTWIGSGDVTVITSVTVFQGDTSLFDFLLASSLNETALAEALSRLDPNGTALRIETVLKDRDENEQESAVAVLATRAQPEALSKEAPARDALSIGVLESISAIVTSQAALTHALAELSEDDLARAVELEMRRARGDWYVAREPVGRRLSGVQEQIQRLAQAEAHVKSLLDRLQEEAIAIRNRSSSLLLKPLAPLADILARQSGREVAVTTGGDDTQLDFSTLEGLKEPLRALVAFAVQHSVESPERRLEAGKDRRGRVHVAVAKRDDQVIASVEDDGAGFDLRRIVRRAEQLGWPADAEPLNLILREGFGPFGAEDARTKGIDFAELRSGLRDQGAELQIANPPSGGTRATVVMPLAMTLVDGMVVRVGAITYVVPIEAIQRIVHSGLDDLMRISAADGVYMLRLGPDEVLPVKFLRRCGAGDSGDEANPLSGLFDAAPAADAGDPEQSDEEKHLFLVAGSSNERCALRVDELVGQETVLVRPLQGHLAGIRGVTGCALLSGGRVGMVLDMSYVVGQLPHSLSGALQNPVMAESA